MTRTAAQSDAVLQLEDHGHGLLVLLLRGSGSKPFVLNEKALSELESAVDEIEKRVGVKGLLIRASHPTVFCAGADIDGLRKIDTPSAMRAASRRGQDLFGRIEALPFPTAALVHGTCVGGGLELAMACTWRIVSDDPVTRLGLPEVQLGILPAWGGTTRLPELIGLKQALGLLLTGRQIDGKTAAALGLADECVPKAAQMGVAEKLVHDYWHGLEHGHPLTRKTHPIGFLDYFIEKFPSVARRYLRAARSKVKAESGGHYPAPLEILAVLERGAGTPRWARLDLERETVVKLLSSPTTRILIGLFAKNRDKDRGAPYALVAPDTASFARIAVIGAGVMGQGIAQHLLSSGKEVRLIDPFGDALARAKTAIEAGLREKHKKARSADAEVARALSRLTIASDFTGLGGVDLVVEAAPEKLAIKKNIFAKLAAAIRPGTIVCTNTSSLSLADIESTAPDRATFAGLHFFNPAPKMPLVEIVRAPGTAEATLVRLVRFARDIGKTPVVVADSPAFAVNRLLAPYLAEAMRLAEEGADPKTVDRAMKRFGLPMGPFELMDTVGLDVILDVSRYLSGIPRLGFTMPAVLERMVEAKHLGKKSGSGFYSWADPKHPHAHAFDAACAKARRSPDRKIAVDDPEAISNRLLRTLAQEARRVLDEKVCASADDLDLASLYGMGFPPYTGGIATWLTTLGEVR